VVADAPVYVTGMAWTTPLGDGLGEVWDGLLAGRTGLAFLPHPVPLRNSLAASVLSCPAELSPCDRLVRMATSVVLRALADARIAPDDAGVLLVLGTSLGDYLEGGARQRLPLSAWADAVACNVVAARPPVSISTACSSGSDAILVGTELIRAGQASACVCVGADVLTLLKRQAHSVLGTMSPTTLRAFDMRHDGTLLGEGAAALVLQSEDRGRIPHAQLRGTGSANDAASMTAPAREGWGARLALARSLTNAGILADEIGLINAHGSGTPLNDETEREAFRAVFPSPARPLVFATKGNFGHSLGATGAIEAVATILALNAGLVPPVVGLAEPDPEFPLPLAFDHKVHCDARFGLSLTLGFGGFDTSLIFEVAR
jgi:3-oxoacyl-[acyl-carrier-protein] synthase II